MKTLEKKRFTAKVEESISMDALVGSTVVIDGAEFEIVQDLGDTVLIQNVEGLQREIMKDDLVEDMDEILAEPEEVTVVITEPTLIGDWIVSPGDCVVIQSEAFVAKQKALAEKAKK